MTTNIKVNAKVLRVLDGDTISVEVKVRFARIDAPEIHGIEKPLGEITKQWLEEKLSGKDIQLVVHAGDVYHRLLADVYLGSEDINDEELADKLAEIYTPDHHNNGKLDV